MRRSIDLFWMDLIDPADRKKMEENEFEILDSEMGEELRGGDRPYIPVIYESSTGHTLPTATTLFEKLGLNTNH